MAKQSFFPSVRSGVVAGIAVAAALLAPPLGARAQVTGSSQTSADVNGKPTESVTLSAPIKGKKKDEKVVQSKDTKKAIRKEKKLDPLAGKDANLPDKQLYDKAVDATKRGHFDLARLELQNLLATYPDSQYQMRAKLAIADSWYKEGGTAALTQAEQEYKDFVVFFPNAPEAAEAQMRIGDIYFRQMDRPDRDYAKAVHAEEEYRRMLTDYPDSKLATQAKQKLREVQEVLATRESSIAAFYATRENWPATIARYQTVVDTYPQYSHMDDVLVGMGDAYESEARLVRAQHNLPEAGKAKLEKTYDDKAAAAYTRVVLEHSASPHVEDAKDRLAAMNLPIPTPSVEQAQASNALENSRQQYDLRKRAELLVFRKADVVQAARVGDPPMVDPKPTMAPAVTRQIIADYNSAMGVNMVVDGTSATSAPAAEAPGGASDNGAPAATAAPAPLALSDVSTADSSNNGGSVGTATTVTPGTVTPGATNGMSVGAPGASLGAEVLTPGVNGNAPSPAAATGAQDPNFGLHGVHPENAAPLPPVEKVGVAPDAVNDIQPGASPAAQAPRADGKKGKPEFDKSDESSSKHKKKKGIKKIDPF